MSEAGSAEVAPDARIAGVGVGPMSNDELLEVLAELHVARPMREARPSADPVNNLSMDRDLSSNGLRE